jgi:hypothetical protein
VFRGQYWRYSVDAAQCPEIMHLSGAFDLAKAEPIHMGQESVCLEQREAV